MKKIYTLVLAMMIAGVAWGQRSVTFQVDMVWWSSLESAQNAADAAMKSTFCAPIFAKMDPQSVKMGHYLSVAS